jgi:hypothetical protein
VGSKALLPVLLASFCLVLCHVFRFFPFVFFFFLLLLLFLASCRFRDSADGWKVKPGDRVSFAPSNMMKRPNPVANDAYIVSSPGDLTVRPIPEPTPQSYGVDEDDDKDEAADFVFWRCETMFFFFAYCL